MIGASCEYCEESYETADGLIADSRGYFCDDFCRGAFTELEESDKLRAELAMLRRDSARPAYSESEMVQKLTAERDELQRQLAEIREAWEDWLSCNDRRTPRLDRAIRGSEDSNG